MSITQYAVKRTLQTVRELGQHFGTVTRCEVLPVPEIVKDAVGWRVDCAYDYDIIIYPNAAQVYRFIIENGVLKPTHPIYTRVGGYKVATFLEMYYQNQSEYQRLGLVCMQLNTAERMFTGGNAAKLMKEALDSAPNQEAANEYRQFYNECFLTLKQYTT